MDSTLYKQLCLRTLSNSEENKLANNLPCLRSSDWLVRLFLCSDWSDVITLDSDSNVKNLDTFALGFQTKNMRVQQAKV